MIKLRITLILLSLLITLSSYSQISFVDYFYDKQMRFDYTIAGSSSEQTIYFEQIKEEPFWGGSKINLLDKFDLGDYRFIIYDLKTNTPIYSRGYSDLFLEWQDIPEADSIERAFYSSIVFPFPKNDVRLEIEKRKKNMEWFNIYTYVIDADGYKINTDSPPSFKTHKIHDSGDPAKKVDILIIPEGYTKRQLKKFKKDCERFKDGFFEYSPFKENSDKFNFWIVDAPSAESGTDNPGKDEWNNTILNTHFYTFDSERYLTTRDVKSIRDIAACAPYDQIYILVNTDKYGGGGIYNFYNLCSSDHKLSVSVFIHEFGHAFAAPGDEYAYSDDPPESRYDLTVEPFQVNLTTLVDFESKWADLVKDSTEIPTEDVPGNYNIVGAFEGAGYVKTKMYRPMHDCRMRSNKTTEFCPVCKRAIIEMIEFYTQ